MKKLLLLSLILLSSNPFAAPSESEQKVYSNTTWAIGTIVTSQVKADSEEKANFCHKLVNDETRKLEYLLSAYDPDSDISKLGENAGSWVEVSKETAEVLRLSNKISSETNGTYDPTVGALVKLWSVDQDTHRIPGNEEIKNALKNVGYSSIEVKTENGKNYAKIGPNQEITLGAIGKGYIADKVMEVLLKNGCSDSLLSFGGNIIGSGTNGENQPWRVGLQTPAKDRGYYFAVLPVDNASIVTSGDYEKFFVQDGVKYHHLLNPLTGKPVRATLSSVTIYHKNSATADALCTALFVMGWDDAINYLKEHPYLMAVLMDEDHRKVAYTKNLEGKLRIVDDYLKASIIQ
ncbi:FAD:protein FMN transferase [Turicimonas muris]